MIPVPSFVHSSFDAISNLGSSFSTPVSRFYSKAKSAASAIFNPTTVQTASKYKWEILSIPVLCGLEAAYPGTLISLIQSLAIGGIGFALISRAATRPLRTEPQNVRRHHRAPSFQIVVPLDDFQFGKNSSLLSYAFEENKRKFTIEKEDARQKAPYKGERISTFLSKDDTCDLMGTSLTPEFALQLNEQLFDIRYFVKAALTQRECQNVFTKCELSEGELKKICAFLGIPPHEFTLIWPFADSYISKYGQAHVEVEDTKWRIQTLGDLPKRMERAYREGDIELHQRLSLELLPLLTSSVSSDSIKRNLCEEVRVARFCQLLTLAKEQQAITPHFYTSFLEILSLSDFSKQLAMIV